MPNFIVEYLGKFQTFWSDRTVSQRIMIGGLAATVVIVFILMVFWLNQTEYRVLYTKLYAEDASRVVSILQSTKEPYKIQDNGSTILVPADKVYDLRLKIAGEGAFTGRESVMKFSMRSRSDRQTSSSGSTTSELCRANWPEQSASSRRLSAPESIWYCQRNPFLLKNRLSPLLP